MKQIQPDEIIQVAHEAGIEVRYAKTKEDVQAEGIHLIEPNIQQLLDGLTEALLHGCDLVMIHSKLTWPYRVR